MIEIDEIVAQILSRSERKRGMLIAPNLKRQGTACRLEMTLHANLELTSPVELCRIYNGAPASVELARLYGIYVRLPRPMTTLAINAFRQRSVSNFATRIRVVARHAAFDNRPSKIQMCRTIIARTH